MAVRKLVRGVQSSPPPHARGIAGIAGMIHSRGGALHDSPLRRQATAQPLGRSVPDASKGNLDQVPPGIVGAGDTGGGGGGGGGGSSPAYVWRGNQLTVLNTKQVRELAVQAATGGSGEVVVLQKFIKPSGPNPWIQRGLWRKERGPHAWVITNKVRGRNGP